MDAWTSAITNWPTGYVGGPKMPHRREALLVDGYEPFKISQRVFRRLPSEPRCKLCLNPFGGLAGKAIGILPTEPVPQEPEHLPVPLRSFAHTGGIEIDIGVVFADVRASTALGEQSNATAFAERLKEFYVAATRY